MTPVKYFEDIKVGYVEETSSVVADRGEMIEYATRHDPYPIHIDEQAAQRTAFGGLIASWGYTVSLFLQLLHLLKLDQDLSDAFLGALEWRVQFGGAVRPGDQLHDRATVTAVRPSSKGGRGVVTSRHELINQNGDVAVTI